MCRVLRDETLQIFYSANDFHFYDTSPDRRRFDSWVRAMLNGKYWREGWIEHARVWSDNPDFCGRLYDLFPDTTIRAMSEKNFLLPPAQGFYDCTGYWIEFRERLG